MGRPKGSKNKKTLRKLGKLGKQSPVAPMYTGTTDTFQVLMNEYSLLAKQVAGLQKIVDSFSLAAASQSKAVLENKLQTIDNTLCNLFEKVDSIERTLSPLMFVERNDIGIKNGSQKETSDEERQEASQEN